MGSTHCNFWKSITRVRVTHNGRYLLKKDMKLKAIEKIHTMSDIGYLVFVQIAPVCFTIKSFDAN